MGLGIGQKPNVTDTNAFHQSLKYVWYCNFKKINTSPKHFTYHPLSHSVLEKDDVIVHEAPWRDGRIGG